MKHDSMWASEKMDGMHLHAWRKIDSKLGSLKACCDVDIERPYEMHWDIFQMTTYLSRRRLENNISARALCLSFSSVCRTLYKPGADPTVEE